MGFARHLDTIDAESDVHLPHLLRPGYAQQATQPWNLYSMDGANLAICIKPALPIQVLDVFSMRGHIWQLSQESNGSRQVQKVLEEASDAGIEQLAVELTGHVLEAAQCPHANFVLQKFITPRAPIALRAITRELIAEGLKA